MDELAKLRLELSECRESVERFSKQAEFYKALLDGAQHDAILVMGDEQCVKFRSNSTEDPGMAFSLECVEGRLKQGLLEHLKNKPVGSREHCRLRMPRKGGGWIETEVRLVNKMDPPVQGIIAYMRSTQVDSVTGSFGDQIDTLLRTIINGIDDCILVLDTSGIVLDANDKACGMFGLAKSNAVRMTSVDRYFPDGAGEDAEFAQRLAAAVEGTPQLFRWKAVKPVDGTSLDVEIVLHKIDLRGMDYVLGTIRDITDRRHLEE